MNSSLGDTGHTGSYNVTSDFDDARPRGGVYPHVDLLPNWKREIAARSGWLVALLVGAISALIVRVFQFHYTGTAMLSETPVLTTAVEAGAAIVLSFLAFLLVPYRGGKYVLLLIVGVGLSITAMHNTVHSAPWAYSLMFSPEWTEEVIETTKPKSLYVLGNVIELVEEKKAAPTILRLN